MTEDRQIRKASLFRDAFPRLPDNFSALVYRASLADSPAKRSIEERPRLTETDGQDPLFGPRVGQPRHYAMFGPRPGQIDDCDNIVRCENYLDCMISPARAFLG